MGFRRPFGASRAGRSGRPIRPMDWECGDLSATVVAGTKFCQWLVLPSYLREHYTDPTLMSTMVWLRGQQQSGGADVNSLWAFGIIVVSAFDDADPVDEACPGPITDCDADWVYLLFAPMATLVAATADNFAEDSHDRVSKARRRLGNDKAILLVGESLGVTAAIHAHVRCLIKE